MNLSDNEKRDVIKYLESGKPLPLLRQYKQDTSSTGLNDWQFLKDNGLAVSVDSKYELTKAGVLLFDSELRNALSLSFLTHLEKTSPV